MTGKENITLDMSGSYGTRIVGHFPAFAAGRAARIASAKQ